MFRWIHATFFFVTAIALFGFVAGPGCQPTKDKATKDKAPNAEKDKHKHGKYGPHGGPFADYEDYHAEVTVDVENKTVVVYILDENAEKAPNIEASRISKVKLAVPGENVNLELKHDAKKSDKDGIAYSATHDFFGKSTAFTANISMTLDEGKGAAAKNFTDEVKYAPKKAEEKKK